MEGVGRISTRTANSEAKIREREVIKKYNALKEAGKLESFIEKRRRKNTWKDHRCMPYRRPNESIH